MQTGWPCANKASERVLFKCHASSIRVSHDSLSQKTKTSGRNRKEDSPSQPDVVFVAMNALVDVLIEEVLTATRMVTAMNPTIAIQNTHAFHLRHSNRLVIANQNAHAYGPGSTLARMKMKTKTKSLVVAMTKMMVASRHNSTSSLLLVFCFLVVLHGLPFRG